MPGPLGDVNLALVAVDFVAVAALLYYRQQYKQAVRQARRAVWWWGWWVAKADEYDSPITDDLDTAHETGPDGPLVDEQQALIEPAPNGGGPDG